MKKLFSYNQDIQRNAYLNWRTDKNDKAHNLYILASDFADSAIVMINAILSDNSDKKADALIMPIFYSIDQSIELYIKTIIRRLEEQMNENVSTYNTHDIAQLREIMESKIRKKEIRTSGLKKHLQPVSDFIDELYVKIKRINDNGKTVVNMDFARYPFDTEGNPHFYIEEDDNVVVDVENLYNRFIAIRTSLEALCYMYEVNGE